MLLLDFIARKRIEQGRMPQNPVAVSTIVSTSMTESVAREYGIQMVYVLTGFKYIGDQIALLEAKGEGDRYIFGFEESYGYPVSYTHLLIRSVVENSRVPVIETGVGNCHVYVDETADIEMAANIIYNAKTSRPSVCNAIETILVHRSVAEKALPARCV